MERNSTGCRNNSKGNPNIFNCICIGGYYDGNYPTNAIIGETRIYKGKCLTQAEITAQIAEMKTAMGLP